MSSSHRNQNIYWIFGCSLNLICSHSKGKEMFLHFGHLDHSTESLQQGQQTMASGPNPVHHLFLFGLQTNNIFCIFSNDWKYIYIFNFMTHNSYMKFKFHCQLLFEMQPCSFVQVLSMTAFILQGQSFVVEIDLIIHKV